MYNQKIARYAAELPDIKKEQGACPAPFTLKCLSALLAVVTDQVESQQNNSSNNSDNSSDHGKILLNFSLQSYGVCSPCACILTYY